MKILAHVESKCLGIFVTAGYSVATFKAFPTASGHGLDFMQESAAVFGI